MARVVTILLFVMALLVSSAEAKDGFYIGAYYPYNSISKDIQGLESGGGLGLRAGVRSGDHFGLELSFFETRHKFNGDEEVEFEGGTLDLKFLMPITGLPLLEPFVFGGVGKYVLEYPTVKYRGNVDQFYRYTEADGTVHDAKTSFLNGYQFGLGADIYLGPELSLGVAYAVRKMYFDWGTPGNQELRARVRSFEIGVNYHF